MAAALTLGAQGVMMASRFLCTKDCAVNEKIKMEVVKRQEYETTIFGRSLGLQGRALTSKVIEDVIAIEEKGGGIEKLIPLINGQRIKEAWETGNVEYAPLMVGQSIGLIRDIPSCEELLKRMTEEAEDYLRKANGLIKA
jgi:nitronate monooxygenase